MKNDSLTFKIYCQNLSTTQSYFFNFFATTYFLNGRCRKTKDKWEINEKTMSRTSIVHFDLFEFIKSYKTQIYFWKDGGVIIVLNQWERISFS